jgi:transposase-like protein
MTKIQQRRVTTWRSKIIQHAAAIGNVARTCRRFGISRKTFYKWRQRFVEHGGAAPSPCIRRKRSSRHSARRSRIRQGVRDSATRTTIEHSLARIQQIQGPRVRYKGLRKNTLDLRRIAVVTNLQRVARLPNAA